MMIRTSLRKKDEMDFSKCDIKAKNEKDKQKNNRKGKRKETKNE